jgi:hypothetical protein
MSGQNIHRMLSRGTPSITQLVVLLTVSPYLTLVYYTTGLTNLKIIHRNHIFITSHPSARYGIVLWRIELRLHSLTTVIGVGEWLVSDPGRFTEGKGSR